METNMVITLDQLRVTVPQAYAALYDDFTGAVDDLEGDDRLELQADGTPLLFTRGGDPECELEKFAWINGEWCNSPAPEVD